jgi:hypothetical protein
VLLTNYDLTILKLYCGNLTLKICIKGERVLPTESMTHNVAERDCGRSLEKFREIVSSLKSLLPAAPQIQTSRGSQNPRPRDP